jgi:hypothetical protein
MPNPGRRNTLNKPTLLKITHGALLGLVLLAMLAGLGVAAPPSPAAPVAPQAADYFMPLYSYKFVSGSTLHSADYTMTEDYQAGACLSVASGDSADQFFTAYLNLPAGARVEYLRIYYYDTNASVDSTAYIRQYDAHGNTTTIASVSSSGSSGYGTTLSAYSTHIFNQNDDGYVLNWLPNTTGSSMRLCGLRVAYHLAALPTYLPYIRNP